MTALNPRTLKLTLAYDGTEYVGWQRQKNGISIQELLEEALGRFDERKVTLIGASRTDAGVHALGQVASVEIANEVEGATLVRALNGSLPGDVRVLCAEPVQPGFHARYAARFKTYRYRIMTGPVAVPFERRYAWHVRGPLDVASMKEASAILRGRHDFAAFQAVGGTTRSSIRTISSMELTCSTSGPWASQLAAPIEGSLLTLEITGDGFLRHMVRAIVGTLVEVGLSRREGASVEHALRSLRRNDAGSTAPPRGLFLVRVDYHPGIPTAGGSLPDVGSDA